MPTTALLETEWVLRGVYGFPAGRLAPALRAFAGLPRVTLEDPTVAARALDGMEAGLDFAGALHLASAQGYDALVTFDRRFARVAKKLGTVEVRVL